MKVNVKMAVEYAAMAARKGWLPHIPHSATDALEEKEVPISWKDYMDLCQTLLMACGAVFRMPGISPGADREVDFAKDLEKPVFLKMAEVPNLFELGLVDDPK
jgi:hypothetical protein